MRSPRLLIVDPAVNGPVFAERLANHHPDINDVPFPKRRDFLPSEREARPVT